ncbi:unnamed protein product [Brassicogethes aeneus]|uniref:Uncharacterized protein n=1 Tax=Brassicogethes aeneus TaxID=1431903 RepID=A0A9P0BGN4_BRAAE|nr:unnamed protein product [Brassicogethes aeneus]
MSDCTQTIESTTLENSRKRPRQPAKWKCIINKKSRYSPQLPQYPECNHNKKLMQCKQLTMADILHFHKALYQSDNKIDQDNFIIKFCSVYKPKRPNPYLNEPRKTLTSKYFIIKKNDGIMIPVCRQTFLKVLGIKRDRVQGVLARHFHADGKTAKENRGGDHKSHKNTERKRKVQAIAIVVGSSTDKLQKQNVHCYHWNESQLPTGSNEIASAIYHRLVNTDMENFTTLRLIADGCGEFLHKLIKKIRKKEVIVQPEEYVNLIEENFTAWNLADPQTVTVYDWRKESKKYLKPPGSWHFQFNPSKRFFLKKTKNGVSVQGEVNYKSECSIPRAVNKKGSGTPNSIKPSVVTVGKKINDKKLKSIDGLLKKHYGTNKPWKDLEQLNFYKDLIQNFDENNLEEPIPEDDFSCEYAEEIYLAF